MKYVQCIYMLHEVHTKVVVVMNTLYCAMSQGSRLLNEEQFHPDQILPLGDVVAVSTKGTSLFIFDAESTNFLKTFDVNPMTNQLVIG